MDEPDLSLKSGELNAEAEAVVEITKELAPGASPYVSAKTFEELNLTPELLKARRAPGRRRERAAAPRAQTLTLAPRRPHLLRRLHRPPGPRHRRGCTWR